MSVEGKLREFIAEYGERACILLKAIYEELSSESGLKLGDFSVKGLRSRLKSWGIEYNPVPLLLKLEKEIGVIETSYRSTTQRWWHVIDMRALENALGECGVSPHNEIGDPRARLLRLQFHVLRPYEILEAFKRIQSRGAVSRGDLEFVRRIAFNELPLLIKIKEEAENLGYNIELREEIEVIEKIVEAAEKVILTGDSEKAGSTWRTHQYALREQNKPYTLTDSS